MRLSLINSILVILAIILTINYFSPARSGMNVNINLKVISYFNYLLFVTSILSIGQFLWPGARNRLVFHVFNIIFIVIFYTISFTFLVHHKDYYDYTRLSDMDTIKRFATRLDIFAIMFWVILVALFFNILYIMKHRSSYLKYQ